MTNLYYCSKHPDQIAENIKNASLLVDEQFTSLSGKAFSSYRLSLPVPSHHNRATAIAASEFIVGIVIPAQFPVDSYYIVDSNLRGTFITELLGDRAHFVESHEDTLKEIAWLDSFLAVEIPSITRVVIGIGGGILLNAAAYIAERRGTDFISVPTTILAAADSAIGGLVRINKVDGELFQKSFYKSVYEPSKIVLDTRFLATLPKDQIRFGLSEVVKHGVYQSPALLAYLASDEFDPFASQDSLLKATCWAVALKNVAIQFDPDSLAAGGGILRGGHKQALAIEEATHFGVSHGEAVAVGVYQDILQDTHTIAILGIIYAKLGLPKTEADLR
jgi:hypothetical protein